ncbi:hypothetical protein ASPWEDRAFT_71901 [Aspergillus wentii DTO 134E9]|uniref:Uncharacterized protein n=1 Tax=Aspergillus wentii DTO 134E9 TaxID=1073089 RepID=A0A1L9R7E5_ASPWE|nr:uncharacterized protein ASPWEDRAFT_71901 [Aspergillus wentii DTO 134E9]OJJ30842.1 hypothetical protein ASPWEDRAFT_71901 [Aspergillus wentii DTO 134E9]
MGSIYREFIRRHDFNSKDTNVSSMLKCRYCELDFQLESRNYPHGPAVIVSRWLGLGDRSYERRWNLCTTEHQKTFRNLGVVFEFGRIRKMFLATDGPSSEFIAMKYEKYLFNNRFTGCMRQWTPHTWILREEVLWLWE